MGVRGDHQNHAARPPIADSDAETMRDLMRQAQAIRPPHDHERQELLKRAGLGDKASQERLVAAYLGLVIRLATEREQSALSPPDLVQEGSIGLVEAVRSFAASGAFEFEPYAEQHIRNQMDEAIAIEATAVRDAQLLVAAATDYERAQLVMRRELEREPTESELAEKLEWTVDRTRYVARVVADARRGHDEELLEFIDPAAIDFDDDERVEFGS